MNLNEIRQKHKLIDLFVELCEIPSPPLKEQALSKKIIEIFRENSIKAELDDFGNVLAFIPAKKGCEKIPPILLSAHMDVVGGSEEVNIRLSEDGKFIETDKTRTLGADNKAGVASIMDLAIDLIKSDINHGPIEITFTRDEEKGMTGARNLDTSRLGSKYAIVADGELLGELDTEGAGFTNVYIKVSGGKGGHSGIDVHDKARINAIKVLSEVEAQIPQGVYKSNANGNTVTSLNAGVITGGPVNTYLSEVIKEIYELGKEEKEIPERYSSKNLLDTICSNSAVNLISPEAKIAYSLRSSDPQAEAELIEKIKSIVGSFSTKYQDKINIELEVKQHLEAFVKSKDPTLSDIIVRAAKNAGIGSSPGAFHAGAETHIFANEKTNSGGEFFNPVIIGVANLENIHSPDEKMDWQSFLRGRKWLEEIIKEFASTLK